MLCKRCRKRKRRFCRHLKAAARKIAKAVRHLRSARELTGKISVEEELTDSIAELRAVLKDLAAMRRRRCARCTCGC